MRMTLRGGALSGPILFNLAFALYLACTVAVTALLGEPHGVVQMALAGGRDGTLVLLLLGLSLLVTFYGIWRGQVSGMAGRLLAAILVGSGIYLYLIPAFAVVKGMISLPFGFWADPMLARLDMALHGGRDAWVLYWPLVDVIPAKVAFIGYNFGWAVVSMGLPVLAMAFDPDPLRRSRVLICYTFVWIGIGNVLAMAFASVGPVYYEGLLGTPRYADYLNAREGLMPAGHAVRELQDTLWRNMVERQGQLGLAISAFPSVHVGIAALTMVYFVSLGRIFAIVGIGYCALTQWSSVVYGWHYALDGYASILLVVSLWVALGFGMKRSVRQGLRT